MPIKKQSGKSKPALEKSTENTNKQEMEQGTFHEIGRTQPKQPGTEEESMSY